MLEHVHRSKLHVRPTVNVTGNLGAGLRLEDIPFDVIAGGQRYTRTASGLLIPSERTLDLSRPPIPMDDFTHPPAELRRDTSAATPPAWARVAGRGLFVLDVAVSLGALAEASPAAALGKSGGEGQGNMELILGLTLSVIMLIMGWRAYTGRWRTWLGHPGLLPKIRAYPAPGMLYGGIGLLAGMLLMGLDTDALPRSVVGILLALFLIGIWTSLLSLVWLPRFMVPRWVETAERAKGLRARSRPDSSS